MWKEKFQFNSSLSILFSLLPTAKCCGSKIIRLMRLIFTKLTWLNYSYVNILRYKFYSRSLFLILLCFCVAWWQCFMTLTTQLFISPLLSLSKIPKFCLRLLSITPWIYQKSERASFCKIRKFSIKESVK